MSVLARHGSSLKTNEQFIYELLEVAGKIPAAKRLEYQQQIYAFMDHDKIFTGNKRIFYRK